MKRWMVLLIIFAVIGTLIVLSGCDSSTMEGCVCYTANCVGTCGESFFTSLCETCMNCPMTQVECNGDPCQFMCDCNIAFIVTCTDSCATMCFGTENNE